MKKIFTCVFTAALFSLNVNIIHAQINTNDSLALVALYNSTNGTNWNNHTNWLTTARVSTWYGITVSNARVSQINLSANNLVGNLPVALGNLDSLTNLTLEFNSLTGSIPTQLGNLHALVFLYLDYNNFTGNIPVELGNNAQLNYLNLNSNSLTGAIPAELGNLTKLQVLDVSYNQLSGHIPGALGNLLNLFNLELRFNALTGTIPSSFNKLTKLNGLDLNSNKLSGKIPALGALSRLFRLSLDHNQLTGSIPTSVTKLTSLLYLYLNNNRLSGKIPSGLNNLSLLADLDLSFNKLSGTIPVLTNLTNLSYFRIDSNKFTFSGMQSIAKTFPFAVYAPQAAITLHVNGNILSFNAGGLANDTYKWYRGATLVATKKDDSTYKPTQNGLYSVVVTNSIATKLTLYSDTVNYSAGDNLIASKLNNHSSVSLYPNPAITNATLSFYADGKYTIIVTDVSGKPLQTKTGVANKRTNNIQIDVSKYTSGMYLITIIDEKNKKQTLWLDKE